MKGVIVALVLALSASAHAAPSRKTKPDKFTRAAAESFRRAMEAEDEGRLRDAIGMYEQSLRLTIHPNTAFNLASVNERDGNIADAIIDYEMYLALAPNAPDAAKVRAKINELEKRPAILQLTTDESFDPSRAYVILDGVVVKRPGDFARPKRGEKITFDLKVGRGRHIVDVVSVLSQGQYSFDTVPGQTLSASNVSDHSNVVDGNVVISLATQFAISEAVLTVNKRIKLPGGKQVIPVSYAERECPPATIDVPTNDDVVFVFAKLLEPVGRSHPEVCPKYQLLTSTLRFPE